MKKLTPYQLAIAEIRKDLKKEGRSFIAFRTELNPEIRKIVKDYSNKQKNLKK